MRAAFAVVVALALGGCGSSEPAQPKQSADQVAAGKIAVRYTSAVAKKDWKTACATRTAAERVALARDFGTCEAALQRVFKGKPVKAFEGVKVGSVNIRNGVAGVQLVAPGGLGGLKVAAVRDHGSWRLKDIPDDQIP